MNPPILQGMLESVVLHKNTDDELDAKLEKRGHFKENGKKQGC